MTKLFSSIWFGVFLFALQVALAVLFAGTLLSYINAFAAGFVACVIFYRIS